MKTLKECKLTPKRIEILDKLGCTSTEDVLTYYPFRYEQIESKPFEEWIVKDKVVFEGTLITYPKTNRFSKGRTMSKFEVSFEDQEIEVTIFNRPWTSNLKLGQVITVFGRYEGKSKVTATTYNGKPLAEQLGIQPVYNLKEGITQKNIQDIVRKVFEGTYSEIENIVPEEFINNYRLLNRKDALRMLHFPKSMQEIKAAYRTLKYEEFLKFNLAMQYLRAMENFKEVKVPKVIDTDAVYNLTHSLSYDLTTDQIKAINTIMAEMNSNKIMYRLLQGDVGCGKTLVAILSLYANAIAGYQGAFLAPTEILAKQHYQAIRELLRPTNVVVEVIYSSLPLVKKKEIFERLTNGEIDILIGTHALLQDSVIFKNLGYVVVDEQQRFGVDQRKKIKEKGKNVDFLLMSATPIPRTLANTLYGDMDITTIETMPKGRVPAETKLVKKNSIKPILKDLDNILANGHQLYVICASIEENENYGAKNVNEIADALSKHFKNYKIGVLHGQMSSDEKDKVMNEFAKNHTQILVSTTVVEVGVNVVNATGMVIYDAHRFGLSQLHQLRGRVKRGKEKGYCYLLTDSTTPEAIERLTVLEKSQDGFYISQEDLRLRGPGDILGTRQSGVPGFILGNLIEDTKIIQQAKLDAEKMIHSPDNSDYQKMIKLIMNMQQTTYRD